MYNVNLENKLIIVDITSAMLDYVALQSDIDETKIKSAAYQAQVVDIERVIGEENVERARDPQTTEDENLRTALLPVICYFTYARLLKGFQGTYTESGYHLDTESTEAKEAKKVANEHASIAEVFLQKVIDFLEDENPDDENVDTAKMHPSIRIFGGQENRASN